MAEQADPAPDRPPVGEQVVAEHLGLARRDRQQAGAGPQQAGLAGPVGPLEQHDLSPRHVEVDAGQDGKAAQQGDGGAKADGGGHGVAVNATGCRPHVCHPGARGVRSMRQALQADPVQQVDEEGGQVVEVVGQQQHPEGGEDQAGDQVDDPEVALHPGEHAGQAPEGHAGGHERHTRGRASRPASMGSPRPRVSSSLARLSTAARAGPMQGDHPKANAMPMIGGAHSRARTAARANAAPAAGTPA